MSRTHIGEMIVFSVNGAKKIRYPMQNNDSGPVYKTKLKVD
jgi:hypothetical protein